MIIIVISSISISINIYIINIQVINRLLIVGFQHSSTTQNQ